MAKITICAEELTRPRVISFADFTQVAIGRSVVSGADWGNPQHPGLLAPSQASPTELPGVQGKARH